MWLVFLAPWFLIASTCTCNSSSTLWYTRILQMLAFLCYACLEQAQIFMQCQLNGRQKCLKMLDFKHAVRTVAWQGSLAWLLLILVLSNAWNVNWKMLSYEFLAFYGQKEGSEIWSFHSSAECHICSLSEWESDRFTSYFLTTLIWDLKLNHSKQIKSSKK